MSEGLQAAVGLLLLVVPVMLLGIAVLRGWRWNWRWEAQWGWLAVLLGLALLHGPWRFGVEALLAGSWRIGVETLRQGPSPFGALLLGLGLVPLLWARQRAGSGGGIPQYRYSLRLALAGFAAFSGAALLQLIVSRVWPITWSLAPRILWPITRGWAPFLLAYGGVVALLLRSGLRGRRSIWRPRSPEQWVGRIALLELLGMALWGPWHDLRWLIVDAANVAAQRSERVERLVAALGLGGHFGFDSDLGLAIFDMAWMVKEGLELLVFTTLSFWMFLLLWDRLISCSELTAGEVV